MKTTAFIAALLISISFSFISCEKDKIAEKHLTELLYMDSQWKMELKYDANGKLISTQRNSTDTLFYNGQGQLTKYSDGYVAYNFVYDGNGHIIRRIPLSTVSPNYHPDTIQYYYDAKNRMTKTVSTFNDSYGTSRQGWIRNYTYNDQNDIIEYTAINSYYNQSENETLSYDKTRNPLNLANATLFFLNEHFYEALNQHSPKRKDNKDFTSIYSYNYATGLTPEIQTIKIYSPGQSLDPLGYSSMRQVKFTYE